MLPPVADQMTPMGAVVVSERRPTAANVWVAPALTVAVFGETSTAVTSGSGGTTTTMEVSGSAGRVRDRRPYRCP